MLSENEKEAIEIVKKIKNIKINVTSSFYSSGTISLSIEEKEAIETVLNLITKLQKENEILKRAFDKQTADMSNNLLELQQKDKQIDLMAEVTFEKFKAPLIIEYGIENKKQFIKIFEQKAKEKRKEYEENNPDNKVEKI